MELIEIINLENEFQSIVDSGWKTESNKASDEQWFIFYKSESRTLLKSISIADLDLNYEKIHTYLELLNEFKTIIQIISNIDSISVHLSENHKYYKVLVHKKEFKKVVKKFEGLGPRRTTYITETDFDPKFYG